MDAKLPSSDQHLSRLTGSLCDAVVGCTNGNQMLRQLENANLFLNSLDDTGEWYRYHALFAEAMKREALPGLVKQNYVHSTFKQVGGMKRVKWSSKPSKCPYWQPIRACRLSC